MLVGGRRDGLRRSRAADLIWRERESMDPSCLVATVQAGGVVPWGIFSVLSRGGQGGESGLEDAVRPAHSTHRPVSGLLGKIPKPLIIVWMTTMKIHQVVFGVHQFACMDTWNEMMLVTVTLQCSYGRLWLYVELQSPFVPVTRGLNVASEYCG